MISKDTYEALQRYEDILRRAYVGHYVYGVTTSAATALFAIYNDLYSASERNVGCTRCVLKVASRLGQEYFAYVPPKKTDKEKKSNPKKTDAAKKSSPKKTDANKKTKAAKKK